MSQYFTEESNRCEILGLYLIENNATVRSTAHNFGISKSTVHKDITSRLSKTNRKLYDRVRTVLDSNKAQRHIRGGEATKNKYLVKRNNSD
ncbi:MAG: sporulation transcriptional regulator SpoIIID [Clostridia bacterium]|nr:sporulation transcriptional regulator SpoIIID [Clostridia bacterium]